MKVVVRTAALRALAGVLILAVVAVSAWAAIRTQQTVRAQVVTTLAIDMVTAGNDDHTVGTIERCVQVSAGETVEFDVVLDAIPAGRNLKGFQYFMGFDDTNLTFTAQLQQNAAGPGPNGINIISRNPAPGTVSCSGLLGCIDGGEAVPEPPDTGSPPSPGVHDVFVVDGAAGATPIVGFGSDDPWGGAGGVLGRYTIAVSASAPSGLYGIGLNDSAPPTPFVPKLLDAAAVEIWDLPGNGIDDDGDGAIDEDLMLDDTASPNRYGLIAVGTICPALQTATPIPTPTVTPTPTPPLTATPTATPTPGPGPANDYFDNATVIPGLPYGDAEYTCGATAEPGEPNCACGSIENSVWYKYTAGADVRLEANTFGSGYDTQLMAYSGPDPATFADLACVGCNDDTGGLQSRVVFAAEAGATYYFQVDGWAGDCGDLVFSLDVAPPPLEVDLSIEPVGQVIAKTGSVTIGGTVTCSKQAFVELSGDLEQRAGRVIIYSHFSDFLVCAGETPWSATVVGENGLYKAGPADVSLSALAFGDGESASAEATGTVRLTGSRPPRLCPRGGNDGFEAGVVDTNVIPCWTVVDQADGWGSWCNQTGTLPPQGACAGSTTSVAAPPEGLQAAMTNQAGPGSHVLYRCGVLRSGLVDFGLYINNEAGVFFTPSSLDYGGVPNQQFRADLVTATGIAADPFTVAPEDVLLNVYQTQPGDPPVSGYTTVAADAGAYVGQPVCLRFAEAENQFFFHAGIDDVNIDLRSKR